MIAFAPCKINLGLFITGKRPDAYHNLETLFYPIPLHDILEIVPSDHFAFSQSGLLIDGSENDNLVVKAWKLMQKNFDLSPVKIHLHKQIPFGAGLGGGSSDAAQTLLLLSKLFGLHLSKEQLQSLAATLGADCPFFIDARPAIGKGIGTDLRSIDFSLAGYQLLIVKPDIHVSTASAYAGITSFSKVGSLEHALEYEMPKWKGLLKNDFEESVFQLHPELQELVEEMYKSGALYAAMSGSGSSIYGIFERETLLPDFPKYLSRAFFL